MEDDVFAPKCYFNSTHNPQFSLYQENIIFMIPCRHDLNIDHKSNQLHQNTCFSTSAIYYCLPLQFLCENVVRHFETN